MGPIRMLMHRRRGSHVRSKEGNSSNHFSSTSTINTTACSSSTTSVASSSSSSTSSSRWSKKSLVNSQSLPLNSIPSHRKLNFNKNTSFISSKMSTFPNHVRLISPERKCSNVSPVSSFTFHSSSLNTSYSTYISPLEEETSLQQQQHTNEEKFDIGRVNRRCKTNRLHSHLNNYNNNINNNSYRYRMNIFNCISSLLLMVTLTFLLVTSFIPLTNGESTCPTKCSCIWRHGKQTTNCESQGLISIPSGIAIGTQVLSLNDNNFQVLPSKAFQERGLTNLQKVFLSKCKLGVIADDALVQLSNLVELDLSNNLLTSVPKEALKETPNLRRLVLSGNPIQTLKKDSFIQISSLNTLDLSSCQISSIEPGAFKGLKSLQFLELDANRLSTLLPNVLQDLNPLYTMDLHQNPWNCDCHLRPAREWMIKYNVPLSIPPTCSGPEKLQGMMWNSLELDEFACSPQILSRDTEITATVGSNASFTCITRAQPEAKVSWSVEDVIYRNFTLPLGSNRENRISFSEDKSTGGPSVISATLTIFNIEPTDSGKQFVCFAENSAGSTSKSFTISVLTTGSAASVGLAGWSKVEIAISIVAILVLILVTFVSIVIWIVRARRFADDASNGSSDDSANGKHHVHHHTGYTTASSDTNSSSVKSSSHSPFPAIDVLKNVPGHSTPSPLGSKEILDSNGHIIGFGSHHHNYNVTDQHTSSMHHLSSHHLHHQNSLNAPYTLSGHHNLGHHLDTSTLEFATATGMTVDAYGNASFNPYTNGTSHVEMFTPGTLDSSHLHLLPGHQLMYQGQGQQIDNSSLNDSQLMLTPNVTTATATLTQVSPHHISPNGTNSSNGGGSTGGSSGGQHCDFVVTAAAAPSTAAIVSTGSVTNINGNVNLNVAGLDSIPVSGTCVICEQSFSDLRLHYMEFHEIRECIV